jgi:hypothetical protein
VSTSPLPPLKYLLECSEPGLHEFLLAQLARAANSRKELREVFEGWVESRALALLAEWLMEYGPQIVTLDTKSLAEISRKDKADERTVAPPRREFWAGEPGFRARKRAG